jgi:hypothetical protein
MADGNDGVDGGRKELAAHDKTPAGIKGPAHGDRRQEDVPACQSAWSVEARDEGIIAAKLVVYLGK